MLTRMQSSRMHTACSSSRPEWVSTRHPPPGPDTHPQTRPPPEQPPGTRHPPAAVAIRSGSPPGTPPDHTHTPRSDPPGAAPWDQAPPWSRHPLGPDPPGSRHPRPRPGTPPVNRMTNRCKNITLRQTSFAGGNNQFLFRATL